jgi:hypothetical protein
MTHKTLMAKKTRDEEVEVDPVLVPYGTYELTQDVQNPKPDRRKSDWLYQAVWEKGTQFIIEDYAASFFTKEEMAEKEAKLAPEALEAYKLRMRCRFQQLRVVGTRYTISFVAHMNPEAFNRLVGSCEQVKDRTLTIVLAEKRFFSTQHILQALLDKKRISMKDVEEAIDFVHDQPDEWLA